MIRKFILLMIVGITGLVKSQIVNIPDANFKAYLIGRPDINTNGDNEIQVSEATSFTGGIYCDYKNISDVKGIEAFINLTTLICYHNKIENLDVSKNIALRHLDCSHNQLKNLDVNKNIALEILVPAYNQLTNLDVTKNKNLLSLYCPNNKILSLDISNNQSLKNLYCDTNELTILNLKNGNNTILTSMLAYNNPNLYCIQVDDITYSTISSSWYKDNTAIYSTDCLLFTIDIEKLQIRIYPNPAKDIINFSEEVSNIKIIDFSGKVVTQISNSEKSINISKLAKGNYIITATTKSGETISKKFIKE